MQFKITNHVIKLTPRLEERIKQRLGLALGRFADRVGTVAVKFVVVKHKGAAVEKRCHVDVSLVKKITVELEEADVFASVDRAVENAARRVAMAIAQEEFNGTLGARAAEPKSTKSRVRKTPLTIRK
jgi:ribosome-associated translation inhibitor RaiA